MKISIDRDGCTECGACEAACGEIYEVKSGEKASIVSKYQTSGPEAGEVPEELGSCAKEGEASCPVEVIHVS